MDTHDEPKKAGNQTAASTSNLPEAEAYATLLVTQYLVDNKLCSEVGLQATAHCKVSLQFWYGRSKLVWLYLQAKEVTTAAVQRLSEFNRRTLDTLAARIYFYFSWSYECCNSLSDIRRWVMLPEDSMSAFASCHDSPAVVWLMLCCFSAHPGCCGHADTAIIFLPCWSCAVLNSCHADSIPTSPDVAVLPTMSFTACKHMSC